MPSLKHGFATGCEAVACRRAGLLIRSGYARGSRVMFWGLARKQVGA